MTAAEINRRMTNVRTWLFRAAFGIAAVMWLILLRPTAMGGSASYVVVAGDSMLPAFSDGTLVVAIAGPPYRIGDVITFAVDVNDPRGRPLVIHRIVSGDAQNGYTTQGDNRPFSDPWTVQVADIVGREVSAIPGVGQGLLLLRSPIGLASIGAGVAAYVALGWTQKSRRSQAALASEA